MVSFQSVWKSPPLLPFFKIIEICQHSLDQSINLERFYHCGTVLSFIFLKTITAKHVPMTFLLQQVILASSSPEKEKLFMTKGNTWQTIVRHKKG